tara:strand:+ start:15489 stop:16517 length:1029 start_codon:yes stop_codon:yes gene_type:complete
MVKNIIYISHAENVPSGGAKIIYRHSEKINLLKNFTSEVLHLKKTRFSKLKNSLRKKINLSLQTENGWQINEVMPVKKFNYNWFNHQIKTRSNFNFDKKKDFVILPEIFAHLAVDLLIKKKINYAIFVQNGYVIQSTNNESKLLTAYKKAKFILSYSNDITKCINLKFPNLKTRIIKISYSINLKTSESNNKINLITFMSRKLPVHSNLVLNYLKPQLPKNWKIINLNRLSEEQTYKILKQSKIFLSFSSFEGLGLPPAEAALAGNFVIGYTGEGGNEYWKKPIFTKINSGEITTFVEKILKKINEFKKNKHLPSKSYLELKNKFSQEKEIKNIKNFLKFTK